MRAPSPARTRLRTVGLALVAAALSTATAVGVASSAEAAPQAPGDFTGFGFDTCSAPSQKTMDAWNLNSPFSAVGIYVSGNSRYCGDKYQPNLTPAWVATNARNGWRFIPIHVGYQSPCFKNNSKSRVQKKHMSSTVSKARAQGRSDAIETIHALKRLGFGPGSTSFLDLEWYSRTKSCDNAVLEFTDAWTETLHQYRYRSGVYSSGSAVIKAIDDALASRRSGFSAPDYIWFAWTNGVADVDAGPYLRSSYFTPHRRMHQYSNGKTVSFGGASVNIDWNWVDIGRGSVPTASTRPCNVTLNYRAYPKLKAGERRAEAAALQCLLKQRGSSVPIDAYVGTATITALDAFRNSLGWSKSGGKVTASDWTALHAAGSVPRVLKRGSVGEPVWRLQRSLRAAGVNSPINGIYDSATVSAVLDYRKRHKLAAVQPTDASVWRLLQRGALR